MPPFQYLARNRRLPPTLERCFAWNRMALGTPRHFDVSRWALSSYDAIGNWSLGVGFNFTNHVGEITNQFDGPELRIAF